MTAAGSGPEAAHTWAFRGRFRRHGFGRRPESAVARVKEAVSEIKAVARKDPVLGAEGAVEFLEHVSPALEHVDGSSGAIGTAVRRAVEALAPIVAGAPVDRATREGWLERLWAAYEEDKMPYIERLGDFWGDLCAGPEVASGWADRLVPDVRRAWSTDPVPRGFAAQAIAALSALQAAGRHEDTLALLALPGPPMWHYRRYGVLALTAMGRKAEALRFAEASRSRYDPDAEISAACEAILLSSGLVEEAYARYAIQANEKSTRLAQFRAIVAKYPHKAPRQVLADLVASTPGEEGKWFAAAKDAGMYAEAIALVAHSPCDPRTLTRAARDFAETEPAFATEAGLAALRWMVAGHGYEITYSDVSSACDHTLEAARNARSEDSARARMAELVAGPVGDTAMGTVIRVRAAADPPHGGASA